MNTETRSKLKSMAHTRYYLKDGMAVPGVTTITGLRAKPGLVPWANKLGLEGIDSSKFVDELANIGSLAHYIIECKLSNKTPELGDYTPNQLEAANKCVIKFDKWFEQNEVKVLATEQQIVSEQYKFGGTCDVYCELNGKKTLIDLKTSKGTFPEHKIQVAAYKQLLEENGCPVEDVRIIRIGRNEAEGFEDTQVGHLDLWWKLFKALLEVYVIEREIKREEK